MSYFVSLDFETTGLSPAKNAEIIEIGAVKFDLEGNEVDSFSTFCAPSGKISSRITRITGIKDKDVRGAISPWEGWNRFLQWAGEFDFIVSHNAPFENSFISSLYRENGRSTPSFAFIDTLKLARRRINGSPSYKLVDLAAYLDIPLEVAHRAEHDSRATAHLFVEIINTYKNKKAAINNNLESFRDSAERATSKRTTSRKSESALNKYACSAKDRPVSIILFLGIFFMPYVFSWLTLRRGYSAAARILSFAWLGWLVFTVSATP